ncbi:hypothetical protein [Amycolatopsis sp. NPDC059657]|uniref:hypothetical protein n=1 Tax=Amycolatopsis sp. NPDC059657 TaxID=3346899 RepID=UPI00366C0C21
MTQKTYRYYAIVDHNTTTDDPFAILRQGDRGDGVQAEEILTHDSKWAWSDLLIRIKYGHETYQVTPITEAQVQQIRESSEKYRESADPQRGHRGFTVTFSDNSSNLQAVTPEEEQERNYKYYAILTPRRTIDNPISVAHLGNGRWHHNQRAIHSQSRVDTFRPATLT